MDPFSDEVLGVKIQVAYLLEKSHDYHKAIEVLNLVLGDCLRWIELVGGKPGHEGMRRRVLEKSVRLSIKLGELYANQHVAEPEAAEEKLVWAVTTLLKEQKRREDEGVKEGEGPWLSSEEIGGALEGNAFNTSALPPFIRNSLYLSNRADLIALGHHYEEQNKHFLAAPLFLQALSLIPHPNCHSIVLSTFLLPTFPPLFPLSPVFPLPPPSPILTLLPFLIQ